MQDVQKGIMETTEADGVGLWQMFRKMVVPLTRAGIAAATLPMLSVARNGFLYGVPLAVVR